MHEHTAAPLPITDIEARKLAAQMPTPAAPDVPAAVGGMIVIAYAALIGAFAVGLTLAARLRRRDED